MAIVKTACKCYKCKAALNAGDNAKWFERTAQDKGHMQRTRSLGYVMVCADEKACDANIGQAYMAKQAIAQQAEAQGVINLLRTVQPEEAIKRMIEHYATQGIKVV